MVKDGIVVSWDTEDIWVCPMCGRKYHLLHRQVERGGKRIRDLKHDFEEIPTKREERKRYRKEFRA